MSLKNLQSVSLKKIPVFVRANIRLMLVLAAVAILTANLFYNFQIVSFAQNQPKTQTLPPAPFRVGERLTYNVSFENINNAAYAEIYAVSRGKLGEKDAIELRSKIKTTELVSAFYLVDETRTTYASSESGFPLYVRKTLNASVLPKETVGNYLVTPTAYNDLLTMIYQARNAGGAGSFSFQEDEKIYNAVFQNTGKSERLKTDAGEFDTTVSTLESNYLIERGITNLRVNFSQDAAKIPVLIRFKTAKGDFRADLASIQLIEPEVAPDQPTPQPSQTPRPPATPKPTVTPTPYIDNEPLAAELPFKLGETLEYQISTGGRMLGLVTLQAKERKKFSNQDSLLLTATVTGTEGNQQVLKLNDSIRAQVNPLSLAPQLIQLNLSGALAAFNQQITFDQRGGSAIDGRAMQMEIPVGTHSILSLAYAVRSFNLKPSRDLTNPVNDTRVAVFLDTKAYVFTLRPSDADIITLQGDKISAQLITVTTGNSAIDQYNLRLWLSNDDKRLPLRLMFGAYQADLVSEKQIPPR